MTALLILITIIVNAILISLFVRMAKAVLRCEEHLRTLVYQGQKKERESQVLQ